MLSSDETNAGGKSKSRKAKAVQEKAVQDGNKARSGKRKAQQVPQMDHPPAAPEQAEAEMPVAAITTVAPASIDTSAAVPAATEEAAPAAVTESPSPADTTPAEPSSPSPAAAAAAEEPVSYRSIADAWGDYSRTSLDQTRSYFEKLAGVRSLGAAFELQAEFARQACETFVAQSRKIGELQGEMAKQRLKRLVETMTPGARDRRG